MNFKLWGARVSSLGKSQPRFTKLEMHGHCRAFREEVLELPREQNRGYYANLGPALDMPGVFLPWAWVLQADVHTYPLN